jgi:phospholipid transport system substrate-binding protein
MGFNQFHWGMLTFYLILGLATPISAGEPTEEIKKTTDKVIAILADPALKGPEHAKERERLIRRAADERFDWKEMARRAMARHWQKRTKEEKEVFVSLFSDLLERTYMKKIESYSGEKVYYEGESIDGVYATVSVKILTSNDVKISVEYRLHKQEGDWLIYDVSIEGVSLINNYRSQFNDIILKSSYEGLVKRLKEKVGRD